MDTRLPLAIGIAAVSAASAIVLASTAKGDGPESVVSPWNPHASAPSPSASPPPGYRVPTFAPTSLTFPSLHFSAAVSPQYRNLAGDYPILRNPNKLSYAGNGVPAGATQGTLLVYGHIGAGGPETSLDILRTIPRGTPIVVRGAGDKSLSYRVSSVSVGRRSANPLKAYAQRDGSHRLVLYVGTGKVVGGYYQDIAIVTASLIR